jgi:hypothetical protein
MTKRISQLTALTGVDLADSLPIVDNSTGQTKRATILEVLKSIYKFSAYRNSAWTTPTSAGKVQFEAENYDPNSNYDASTNFRYTVPVNGTYHFDASVGMGSTAGTGISIFLYKNGVQVRAGDTYITPYTSGFPSSLGVSCDLQLVAGDYVEVYVIGANTAGTYTNASSTGFNGHLVAPE